MCRSFHQHREYPDPSGRSSAVKRMQQAQTPELIPQQLLDAVMQRGAGDNVTIVLLQKA